MLFTMKIIIFLQTREFKTRDLSWNNFIDKKKEEASGRFRITIILQSRIGNSISHLKWINLDEEENGADRTGMQHSKANKK